MFNKSIFPCLHLNTWLWGLSFCHVMMGFDFWMITKTSQVFVLSNNNTSVPSNPLFSPLTLIPPIGDTFWLSTFLRTPATLKQHGSLLDKRLTPLQDGTWHLAPCCHPPTIYYSNSEQLSSLSGRGFYNRGPLCGAKRSRILYTVYGCCSVQLCSQIYRI